MVKTLRLWVLLPWLGLAIVAFAVVSGVGAQSEGPQITYQNLNDGDVLTEPPHVVQFCFAEPVTNEASGVDYRFVMTSPEGLPSGSRTVFQRDDYGVAIYPGDPPARPSSLPTAPDDIWTFEWLVTDAATGETSEGVITFILDEGGETIPNEDPAPCLAPTTAASPGATQSASATPGDGDGDSGADDDDGGNDTLLIVLIAAGAAGSVVLVILAALFGRSRMRRARKSTPGGDTPAANEDRPAE